MKPVAELLQEKGFSLDVALHHMELIPFVKTYLFKPNPVTLACLMLNLFFVGSWLYLCILYCSLGSITPEKAFSGSAYGCAIPFLLAPLHELLHGAAYRLSGARKVSYKTHWKKLYFMAIADKFIAGRSIFYFVALTPFIVISCCLIGLSIFATPGQQVMWLTALWVHASMCAGDFGLMSYFAENKTREVITYDDAENGISYFYSRGWCNSVL